jgi:TPR repeat protein
MVSALASLLSLASWRFSPLPRLLGLGSLGFVFGFFVPAAAEPRVALTEACVRSLNSESCDRLGDMVERGHLAARYPEEAGLYFALACEGGLARSCRRAQAWATHYSDYETLEIDVGCMLRRNGFACEEVANALRDEREEGVGADTLPLARSRMRRALEVYLDGCAKDEALSCLGASRVYALGFGVPWNPREARAKEEKACALGLGAACEQEGDHRSGGDAIPPYRRACELLPSSPHACLKLARAYESERSQPALIESSYRRACELLSFDACLWVSQNVEGLDAESPDVLEAFRRWCGSGSQRACGLVSRVAARAP